jgi:uncharacterized protein (TIGR03067 family)
LVLAFAATSTTSSGIVRLSTKVITVWREKAMKIFSSMSVVSVVTGLVICLLGAPVFAQPPQTLEGEWTPMEGQINGQTVPADVIGMMSLKISQDRFDAKSGDLMSQGKLMMGTGSSPAQIVFVIDGGNDTGREIRAIYSLVNQQLTIAFSQSGEFPTDYVSTETNRVLVMKYNNPQAVVKNQQDPASNLPRLGPVQATGL